MYVFGLFSQVFMGFCRIDIQDPTEPSRMQWPESAVSPEEQDRFRRETRQTLFDEEMEDERQDSWSATHPEV